MEHKFNIYQGPHDDEKDLAYEIGRCITMLLDFENKNISDVSKYDWIIEFKECERVELDYIKHKVLIKGELRND